MSEHDDFAGLPPRPDPETGEPFPPHGRAWHGPDRKPEDDPERDIRLSHKPNPPAGKGPVLAWHKESKRGKVTMFVGTFVFFVVALTVIQIVQGNDQPLEWMGLWQLWIIVAAGCILIARPLTYISMSAGADWFQVQLVRFGVTYRRKHVNLYALRKIKITTGTAALFLELADDTDFIYLATVYWHSDRRIWDLVYNGILHSVATGAETNHNSRGYLKLNEVPQLRYPHGARTIDVTQLSDVHVWELMDDPSMRSLCDSIQFHGSAAQFRNLVPEIGEDMLTNAPNPDWFRTHSAHTDTSSGSHNTEHDQ